MFVWRRLDREFIRRALAIPAPVQGLGQPRNAAVGLLLAEGARGVDLLLIHRSERASDPWSGQMALPGGHSEAADRTLLDTAIREVREEIGVDLRRDAELLGPLDDVVPANAVPLLVRPFVFALERIPTLSVSPEVQEVVWVNLKELEAGIGSTEYELCHDGQRLRFPGFRAGGQIVWGLTYRVLAALLSRAATLARTPASAFTAPDRRRGP